PVLDLVLQISQKLRMPVLSRRAPRRRVWHARTGSAGILLPCSSSYQGSCHSRLLPRRATQLGVDSFQSLPIANMGHNDGRPMFKAGSVSIASLLWGRRLCETALRVLGWTFPIFAQPDLDLGWSFRPRVSGWSNHENTAYVQIKRCGFRGENWPEQPASGRFRI